jgi:hypothetical protein
MESGGAGRLRSLSILLVLLILLGIAGLLWLRWRGGSEPASEALAPTAVPVIDKQPPVVATRRFDPAAPPPEMPPLHPGEEALCDSNFLSSALVSGETRRTGAAAAVVTINAVKMQLRLVITIWVPEGVTQHVLEHEEGHRQISEFYYRDADQLARRLAASYIGKQLPVEGSDTNAAANAALQHAGDEITAEYGKQLNPNAAQLRYDAVTDHARNEVSAQDAIAQVLQE